MKLKSVRVGNWYTVQTKKHPAHGRSCRVTAIEGHVITIQVGHFNSVVYRVSSGDIKP